MEIIFCGNQHYTSIKSGLLKHINLVHACIEMAEMVLSLYISQHWHDYYLQWNQSEYPGVKNLRFTTDQVWTPDILLYNRYISIYNYETRLFSIIFALNSIIILL